MRLMRLLLVTACAVCLASLSPALAASGTLPTRGGAVMHHPTIYTIFWVPPGYHFHGPGSTLTDGDFEDAQMQFLSDVSGSDYYGILTQYSDRSGPVEPTYTLTDPVIDTHPFPAGRGTVANPLLNSDVYTEIYRVANTAGLKNIPGEALFHMYTPFGVQTCSNDLKTCSLSPLRPKGSVKLRCAFHSYFTARKQKWIYALVSIEGVICHGWQKILTDDTAPNGDALSDMAASSSVHEIAEAVTDPYFNAYVTTGTTEVGDKCGSVATPTDDTGGNVQMGDNSYYIQTMWSNEDNNCVMALGG